MMRVLLVVVVLVASCLLLTESSLLNGSVPEELNIYEAKIRYIHLVLARECPSYVRQKRQSLPNNHPVRLDVLKGLYEHLLQELAECLGKLTPSRVSIQTPPQKPSTISWNIPSTRTTPLRPTTAPWQVPPVGDTTPNRIAPPTGRPTTTPWQVPPVGDTTPQTIAPPTGRPPMTPWKGPPVGATTPNTIAPPTRRPPTLLPQPPTEITPKRATTTTPTTTTPLTGLQLCDIAVNFTETWRRDHNGSNIKPGGAHSSSGYTCDFHKDAEWFRFSGDAGTHMLDSCPKYHSCGTFYPYWTNEMMPKEVGVEATVTVYGVEGDNCQKHWRLVEVMRCSNTTAHDLIYKPFNGFGSRCLDGFCGMM